MVMGHRMVSVSALSLLGEENTKKLIADLHDFIHDLKCETRDVQMGSEIDQLEKDLVEIERMARDHSWL